MTEQAFWNLLMHWGYIAVAIGVLIEGETFLVIVGIAAATSLFDYSLVIVAATIGAIIHDNGVLFFSKITGKKFLIRYPKLQAKADRSLELLNKYDYWAILSIRFLYGLRTITIFIVGLSDIRVSKFVILDGISSLIWSFIYITLGYFCGQAILDFVDHVHLSKFIHEHEALSVFIVILISTIIYVIYSMIKFLIKRRHK